MMFGLGARIVAAALAGTATIGPGIARADLPADCTSGWTQNILVSGVGNLENLDTDGDGGFFVTGIMDGYLAHISRTGHVEKLVTGLFRPAGVQVVDRSVYFLTGNNFTGTGTLERYNRDTGTVDTLLTDLNGPNGLLLLPDGDLLISTRGIGAPPTGIARYRPATAEFDPAWAALPMTNGLALTPDRTAVFATDIFTRIHRIPLDAPADRTIVTAFPRLPAVPDDLEATRDGLIFVTDHALGNVYQVDPRDGSACAIATGLLKPAPIRIPPDGPTAVRIARDADSWALFITGMDGTLRRLRPPAGTDLTPVRPGS